MSATTNGPAGVATTIPGFDNNILAATASCSTLTNNNRLDLYGYGHEVVSHSFGDPIITFGLPSDQLESSRRRNNSILAKIQELEANASVQAARSERLRMMREEYESLVRKYAYNRTWNSPPSQAPSHGFMNGINGSQLQQSTVAKESERGVCAIGVNTDITGPIRSTTEERFEFQDGGKAERKKVKVVIDAGSQTERDWRVNSASETSLSHGEVNPFIYDETRNEKGNVSSRKLPVKMEMLMMLEDEEDESLLEAQERTKFQLQHFHHQVEQPRASLHVVDDNNSISIISSATSSPAGEIGSNSLVTLSENPRTKLQQKQKHEKEKEKQQRSKSEKTFQGKHKKHEEAEDEISQDTTTTTTMSFANARRVDKKKLLGMSKVALLDDLSDLSASDSIAAAAMHRHQTERKKLLELLTTSTQKISKDKRKSEGIKQSLERGRDDFQDSLDDQSITENTEEGMEKKVAMTSPGEVCEKNKKTDGDENGDEDDLQQCSSAGATSESIGDSLMDSIQKTPETLPRDDSELHEIAEVNEEEHEHENVDLTHRDSRVYDDGVTTTGVIAATGASGATGLVVTQSGVNDKFWEKSLKEGDIKELVGHQEQWQINDAQEIRSNNLSSSKFDVLENPTHANNPDERESTTRIITTATTTPQPEHHQPPLFSLATKTLQHFGTNSEFFYRDVRQGNETTGNYELLEEEVQTRGEQIEKGASGGIEIELNKRHSISHSSAPSANLSAHSSSTSSSTSASHVVDGARAETQLSTQKQSSTGSSSVESSIHSRRHSLQQGHAERVDANTNKENETGISAAAATAGVEVVEGERDWNEAGPTNNSNINNNLVNNEIEAKKVTHEEKVDTKTTTLSLGDGPGFGDSPGLTENPAGFKGNGSGTTNFRSTTGTATARTSRNASGVPVKQASAVTVPSGPPGARYTGRRVRLKLNYDDSESDSSEIGSAAQKRTQPQPGASVKVGDPEISQQNHSQSSTNTMAKSTLDGEKVDGKEKESGEKKKDDDDDFDDFFDI